MMAIGRAGPVLTRPQLVLCFRGSGWATGTFAPADARRAIDAVLASPYLSHLVQYRGIRRARVTFTTPVDTSDIGVRGPDPRGFVQGDIWLVSDADIRKIVSDAAQQRPAAAGEELIYLVLISQDPIPIVTQLPNANGYHDTFDDAGTPRIYGVVLTQAARIAEAIWLYLPGVFAHELVEASTDPDVKTGYVLDTGDELCDMNKTQTVTLDGLDHPVELALYWSELEGAAVAPTTYSLRIHLGVRAAQTVPSVRSAIPGASMRNAILAGCNP